MYYYGHTHTTFGYFFTKKYVLFLYYSTLNLVFKYFSSKFSYVSNAVTTFCSSYSKIHIFLTIRFFLIPKDMYLVSLKLLTYWPIFGSLMHNGLIFKDFFIFVIIQLKTQHQLCYFCLMQIHQVFLFYFIYIVYSYLIFGRMKLLLFNFIATESQEVL